jgi:hypothetical protein
MPQCGYIPLSLLNIGFVLAFSEQLMELRLSKFHVSFEVRVDLPLFDERGDALVRVRFQAGVD